MVMKVGLVGCGNIAPAYLTGCSKFPELIQVTACTDMVPERAQEFGAKHGLKAHTVASMLADPEIDILINLTVPAAHAEVSAAIIQAGKHVYSEKPLALNRADGKALLDAATAAGVRIGCAPDTFLGGGQQTCRARSTGRERSPTPQPLHGRHGPDSWHPNPSSISPGRRPMWTWTVLSDGAGHLLGPMKRIGPARRAPSICLKPVRKAARPADPVSVNTHAAGSSTSSSAAATVIRVSMVGEKPPIIAILRYGRHA